MFCRAENKKFIRIFVITLLFAIVPLWSVSAVSQSPTAVVQSGTDRALKILRSTQKGEAPALRQRRGEILNIVDEYFNFEEMARRALGRPWKEQTPEKRQEFVRLFKQLLFNTYIGKVESYTGSNEKIYYDAERIEGEFAIVKTRVVDSTNQTYVIEYRLRLENGQWKAYDVIAEGVSFVDNYRSQFAAILANESFDSLLKKMRDKVGPITQS